MLIKNYFRRVDGVVAFEREQMAACCCGDGCVVVGAPAAFEREQMAT